MESEAALRTRLLDVALRMLAEGTAEPTLRAVARTAGVSAMAPYRHFADKADLMQAVKERGFDLLRDRVRDADAADDDHSALLEQGLAYVRFAHDHPALFRLMFAKGTDATKTAPTDEDNARGILARRVARIVPEDAQSATMAAWSIVHGLATLTLDGRIAADTASARAVLSLFVAGLAAAGRAH